MSILMTFRGKTEHFRRKNEALRRTILVEKQKCNVQKPYYVVYTNIIKFPLGNRIKAKFVALNPIQGFQPWLETVFMIN